ncbi:hypothetical protein [Sphingomonas sp.]|uniref:hypothetical protein n=1 Tax=Sphingomonas sp. TaxID=28214 RepID=UPI00307CF241
MTRPTVLVAGFGRCGSSLVMQMLHAGGMPCDGTFPDFEAISLHLMSHDAWIARTRGRAVKVLDPHLYPPPVGPDYRTIWLTRDPSEQARSALKLIGGPDTRHARRAFARSYVKDRRKAIQALMKADAHRAGILELSFEAIIREPLRVASSIAAFVGIEGRVPVAQMAKCVIPRPVTCLPFMLERQLIARGAA